MKERNIMEKNNKRGFTLAELLIVVAIIAVLVAVAIPVFNNQLEKSKKAVDEANIRSAYSEAMATYLTDPSDPSNHSGMIRLADVVYDWNYESSTGVMTVSTQKGSSLESSAYKNGITYNGTSFSAGAAAGD